MGYLQALIAARRQQGGGRNRLRGHEGRGNQLALLLSGSQQRGELLRRQNSIPQYGHQATAGRIAGRRQQGRTPTARHHRLTP